MIVRHSLLSLRPTLDPPVVLPPSPKADIAVTQVVSNINTARVNPYNVDVDQQVLQVEPTKPTWVKWLVVGLGAATLGIMIIYLVKT